MDQLSNNQTKKIKYKKSEFEKFIEEVANCFDLKPCKIKKGEYSSLIRESKVPTKDSPDHIMYLNKLLKNLREHKFEEIDKLRNERGIITFQRFLPEPSINDNLRRLNFTNKDYLLELINDEYPHIEKAEITKGEKQMKVEFQDTLGYNIQIYNFQLAKIIPHHKIRCCINTNLKHDLWQKLEMHYCMFEELEGTENKTPKEIATQDTYSIIKSYFEISKK